MRKKSARDAVAGGLPAIYPRLWRFCLVLTRDRAMAEDLAQMTCERALIHADKFTPGSDLASWLFTMARNLWLNDIRAANVRRGTGTVPVEQSGLTDEKPDIEANILAREVFDIIQALPEAQRLTTLLVYVEGHTYREAAEILDVPIGTIMSRLASARKAVTQVVEGQEKTGE
ncbi:MULTISPECIES: RNA polymerase sigma factor [unclassified Cognatiyoonia]|uniref:RNA polymerase sigma factor n=1 Tax=unclassified Cognatiyoonia TaxID=2635977 RepID=UPI002A129D52|nr:MULTISPECIES: RNA polymerase sigma factor [unclassified Cognatiyoonia]MDX8347111.1 RNA polymerase sigma factor [Cognatiyoonia sp. IB215446]MDX8351647.1 RNA polymerase sigma factor [Cognatiyoonia sp. IB215182]